MLDVGQLTLMRCVNVWCRATAHIRTLLLYFHSISKVTNYHAPILSHSILTMGFNALRSLEPYRAQPGGNVDVRITCSSNSLLLGDINPWMYHANDHVQSRAHCQRRLCEFCHSGPIPWRIYDADSVSRTVFDYAICIRRSCYKSRWRPSVSLSLYVYL